MDIYYESAFHKQLYTRTKPGQAKDVWRSFVGEYPQYEKYTEIWLLSRNERSMSPLNLEIPWINYPAIDYISKTIGLRDRVFEFGMGGSTIFFFKRCRQVISIEHDNTWFSAVKEVIDERMSRVVKRLERSLKLQIDPQLYLVEPTRIKKDTKYGSGAKGYENLCFYDYVSFIEEWPKEYFSCILVDGRARLAALLNAIPYVASHGMLVLDNSDYLRFHGPLEELRQSYLKGWTEIPLLGPGPYSNCIGWKTTIFKKAQ